MILFLLPQMPPASSLDTEGEGEGSYCGDNTNSQSPNHKLLTTAPGHLLPPRALSRSGGWVVALRESGVGWGWGAGKPAGLDFLLNLELCRNLSKASLSFFLL